MSEAGKLPAPAAVGARDRRLEEMGFGGTIRQTEEQKDSPTGREQRMLRKSAAWGEMTKVLGCVMAGATDLQTAGGGTLGQARDRRGKVLRWSYWSPSRMLLIDRFRDRLPATEELEDRRDFAERHGIRYAVVAPGAKLAANEVREMLEAMDGGK